MGHLRCRSKRAGGLIGRKGLRVFLCKSSLGKGLQIGHLRCQTKRKVYNVVSVGSGLQKGNLKGVHICREWLTELGNLKGVHICREWHTEVGQLKGVHI